MIIKHNDNYAQKHKYSMTDVQKRCYYKFYIHRLSEYVKGEIVVTKVCGCVSCGEKRQMLRAIQYLLRDYREIIKNNYVPVKSLFNLRENAVEYIPQMREYILSQNILFSKCGCITCSDNLHIMNILSLIIDDYISLIHPIKK